MTSKSDRDGSGAQRYRVDADIESRKAAQRTVKQRDGCSVGCDRSQRHTLAVADPSAFGRGAQASRDDDARAGRAVECQLSTVGRETASERGPRGQPSDSRGAERARHAEVVWMDGDSRPRSHEREPVKLHRTQSRSGGSTAGRHTARVSIGMGTERTGQDRRSIDGNSGRGKDVVGRSVRTPTEGCGRHKGRYDASIAGPGGDRHPNSSRCRVGVNNQVRGSDTRAISGVSRC